MEPRGVAVDTGQAAQSVFARPHESGNVIMTERQGLFGPIGWILVCCVRSVGFGIQ